VDTTAASVGLLPICVVGALVFCLQGCLAKPEALQTTVQLIAPNRASDPQQMARSTTHPCDPASPCTGPVARMKASIKELAPMAVIFLWRQLAHLLSRSPSFSKLSFQLILIFADFFWSH